MFLRFDWEDVKMLRRAVRVVNNVSNNTFSDALFRLENALDNAVLEHYLFGGYWVQMEVGTKPVFRVVGEVMARIKLSYGDIDVLEGVLWEIDAVMDMCGGKRGMFENVLRILEIAKNATEKGEVSTIVISK